MSATVEQLTAAAAAGNDEEAEALSLALTPADEPALLSMASSPDPDQQWWAVRGLAVAGSASAIPVVTAALQSEEPPTRAAALLTLGALHARTPDRTDSVFAAMAVALKDDDGMVRQVAGDVLARCGDDAVPVLADVMAGTHPGARTRAALALGKIATMPAAAVLYRYLNDENYLVREYAYAALDDMGLLENQLFLPG